jgi:hypothetical protein
MAKKKVAEAQIETITTYKAFNKNMKCRGYQFEEGKTYTHTGPVAACSSGFHSCENPLDVLNYYDLCDSRFARVTIAGTIDRHSGDSKIASGSITIDAEIKIPEFIKAGVNYLMGLCKDVHNSSKLAASGHYSQLAASGHYSQLAASGDYSKLAASGDYSKLAASGDSSQLAASGDSSQLAASGDSSKLAASGDSSKLAASGHYSQLAASGHSSKLAASGHSSKLAASGHSSQLAASGDSSKLAASGHSSKLAASGHSSQLAASGDSSVAMCAGVDGKAKVGINGAIALSRWVPEEKRYRISVAYEGENGIKADTWYELDSDGSFVEAK